MIVFSRYYPLLQTGTVFNAHHDSDIKRTLNRKTVLNVYRLQSNEREGKRWCYIERLLFSHFKLRYIERKVKVNPPSLPFNCCVTLPFVNSLLIKSSLTASTFAFDQTLLNSEVILPIFSRLQVARKKSKRQKRAAKKAEEEFLYKVILSL